VLNETRGAIQSTNLVTVMTIVTATDINANTTKRIAVAYRAC